MSTTLALLSATILWLAHLLYRAVTGPFRKVPGPWYTLFTRVPLGFFAVTGRRISFVHSLHQRYGNTVRIAPNEISCADPQDFKIIHGHGNGWFKSDWYARLSDLDADPEVHNEFSLGDPTLHGARRKLFARAFSKSEIRRNWEDEVRKMVERAMMKMGQEASSNSNGEVDVRKWWVLLASDASSRMAFGESFGLLDVGHKNDYVRTLERVNAVAATTAEFPVLRGLGRLIPVKQWRSFWNSRDKNREYARHAVASSRRVGSQRNVFTPIVAEAEREGSRVSEQLLINEAAGLIVAGSDTTANSLTYLAWVVLCRPELQEALVSELRNNLPGDEFNDQDLEKLPILNAAIKETMRLYGAAPASLPRTPPRGGATLSDGSTYVPEGATASTQSWTLHRDPKTWPNPEEFDISRWMPDKTLTDTQKLVYSPFGWGPRSCLGIHFAQMEMRYAAALFFRKFPTARLASVTTDFTMKPKEFFVISPVGGECKIMIK